MTARKTPKLDQSLAALPVPDEMRTRWRWPLAGLLDRPVTDVRDLALRLDAVLPALVDVARQAEAITTACRSNARAKPGARLTLLLAALAGHLEPVPDKVVDALAAVLRVSDTDLRQRARQETVDWLDDPETVALQAIQRLADLEGVEANQGERLGVRLAIYDLVCLYRQRGLATSPRTINALACYVGLSNPSTGEIDWALLGGRDPRTLEAIASYNAEEINDAADDQYAELAEKLGYEKLRRLTEGNPARIERALAQGPDSVLARVRRLEQNLSRLAGFRDARKKHLERKLSTAVGLHDLSFVDQAREVLLRVPANKVEWADLAMLAGLTLDDLLVETAATAEMPARALAKNLEGARSSKYEALKDKRYDELENAAIKKLGETQRLREQFDALQDDAFAAASGDAEAKARLKARAGRAD